MDSICLIVPILQLTVLTNGAIVWDAPGENLAAESVQLARVFLAANSAFWGVILVVNAYIGCCLCSHASQTIDMKGYGLPPPRNAQEQMEREKLLQQATMYKRPQDQPNNLY